ncbi:MAG: alpha/beta fold hydrolase, partial [Geminicoccaceae bacterium]
MNFIEAGEGPPLVLLHGIGGHGESFAAQVDAFADRFRCLSWNMPGYAGRPLDGPLAFDRLASTLLAELAEKGVSEAHFLGHSIGGMIAQEIAATRPEVVRSMVLVATSPAFGGRDPAFREQFLAQRLAPLDAGITMNDLAAALVTTLVSTHAEPEGVRAALAAMRAVPEATYRAVLDCLVTFDRRAAL